MYFRCLLLHVVLRIDTQHRLILIQYWLDLAMGARGQRSPWLQNGEVGLIKMEF